MFNALSTVLVVLDCSGIFEKRKNSQKLYIFGFEGYPFHYFRAMDTDTKSGDGRSTYYVVCIIKVGELCIRLCICSMLYTFSVAI